MTAELVIFDCDGVLVDSVRLVAEVDRRIFIEDYGWDISVDEIMELFEGRSNADVRALSEIRIGRPLRPDWEAKCSDLQNAAFDAELTAVNGIEEALDAVERAGLRMCVATSGDHAKVRHTLTVTGLYPRFAGRIFSAEDKEVQRGKPAPDLFLYAAKQMGVDPADCVVVEDSVPGVQAARAAGMRAIAFADLTPADRLKGPETMVITDMRELPALLAH